MIIMGKNFIMMFSVEHVSENDIVKYQVMNLQIKLCSGKER